MIRNDAWQRHCIWEHSSTVHDLYARRCRREADEMTSHAQAAELLSGRVAEGDTLLDAGCGSGYFYHSLVARGIQARYVGIDAAPSLIELGQRLMPQFGLPATQLKLARIEDIDGEADHVVCLNVLSNIDNYHRPLDRLLQVARKSLVLRESMRAGASYAWVRDRFLDPGVDLSVHVNHYDIDEVLAFVRDRGFRAEALIDRRTGGQPEEVIGYPHHWTFLVADRI